MTDKKKPPQIRQHFVPQSYLNLFADKQGMIHCFDKANPVSRRFFSCTSNQIANERYFYTNPEKLIKTEQEQPIMEDAMGSIEAKCIPVIREVANVIHAHHSVPNNPPSNLITQDQRIRLAYFIAVQYLRTRAFRSALIENRERHYKEKAEPLFREMCLKNNIDMSLVQLKMEYQDDHAGLEQLKMIFGDYSKWLAADLATYIWIFAYNNTPQPFYTSDNPVVTHSFKRSPFRHLGYFIKDGMEITFPLTPRCSVVMHEKRAFRDSDIAQMDGKAYPILLDNVIYYNHLQVYQSSQQVYSCEPKFEFAEKMGKENPEMYQVAQENRAKKRSKQ